VAQWISHIGETTCFDLLGMQLKERSQKKTTLGNADDVVLSSLSGLLDKNGQGDIRGGDIVSECVVGQVIWNGDAEILSCPCGVVTQYPTYLNLSQDKKGLVRLLKPKWKLQAGDTYNLFLSKYDGLYTWPKDIEVIGNIYENPELLS
jgi:uncharacterized phage protein (TIGR01671 family)